VLQKKTERNPKRGEVIDLVYFHGKSVGDRGDRRHRRGPSSLPRRPLLTALPRRAVYGGADRAGLIFFSFFFLGLLLLHSLIGLLPHFFEVIGFRLTRFPR
jgi:hypothetical protein